MAKYALLNCYFPNFVIWKGFVVNEEVENNSILIQFMKQETS